MRYDFSATYPACIYRRNRETIFGFLQEYSLQFAEKTPPRLRIADTAAVLSGDFCVCLVAVSNATSLSELHRGILSVHYSGDKIEKKGCKHFTTRGDAHIFYYYVFRFFVGF